MKKSVINKVEEFKSSLNQEGWTFDKYGHAKKTIDNSVYRFKFGRISYRKEILRNGVWHNLGLKVRYYKDL